MRVLVDVDLRQTLRLTRREKKARLFLPREVKGSLEAFLDHVYQVCCLLGAWWVGSVKLSDRRT